MEYGKQSKKGRRSFLDVRMQMSVSDTDIQNQ